ncbi:MAG: hypothetical protein KC933_42010, partial [Myxococcales bacterium]|nr:hypothetical protein [Myxococcales bacterium]
MPSAETGTQIPPGLAARFEVCELLGTGAFSQVFRVERRADGEVFALKLVPIRGDGRREEREVQLALDVQHPFLIHTYEA